MDAAWHAARHAAWHAAPAASPQSDGTAEGLVNTLRRDYIDGADLSSADVVLDQDLAESLSELANAHELILAADTNHEYCDCDELLCRVATLAGHSVHWRAELDVAI